MTQQAMDAEKDRTIASLTCALVITLVSITFFFAFEVMDLVSDSSASFQSSHFALPIIGVFRFGCAYLAFHTIVFWMIRNPVPGRMFVTLHETNDTVMLQPTGFERISTFSSWTLMVFGCAFLSAGTVTWLQVFDIPVPTILTSLTVVLMPVAYGSAFITATVVRYVIIPDEIAQRRPFASFFLNYELVMHNYTAILLAVDLFLVQAKLNWEFGIFPVYFGIIYVLFSYAYARTNNGYYIYNFLDPRMRMAPVILIALASACCVFYIGLWLVSLLIEWNVAVGGLVLAFWVSRIVLFRRQVGGNDYAYQSSS